jgi:thymidine kinase
MEMSMSGTLQGAGAASERGIITLISGCMFSGKTTALFRLLERCPPESVPAFKHVIDQRYAADQIVSHDGKGWPAVVISNAVEIPGRVGDGVKVVALDEAHFFYVGLVQVVRELASRGIDVILTSLDRNSWGRPFAVAEQLRAIADQPVTLHAVCARCGATADRTQRLTPIVNAQMVGGPESYEARCQACWSPPPEDPVD